MRRILAALLSIITIGSTATAQHQPVSAFARMPDMDLVSLSPDGRHLAFLSEASGVRSLIVHTFETGVDQAIDVSTIRPNSLVWSSDTMLLLSSSNTGSFVGSRHIFDFSAVLAIDSRMVYALANC